MLGNENRMAAHWSLAPVVQRLGRREALPHEVSRVLERGRKAPLCEISALILPEAKAAAERRAVQAGKNEIEIAHGSKVGLSTRFVRPASRR